MKNKVMALLLGLSVAAPAMAQDMTVDESDAYAEAAYEETAPLEDTAMDESAASDAGDAPVEDVSEDAASMESAESTDYADDGSSSEEGSFDDGSGEVAAYGDGGYSETAGSSGDPLIMYVGLDKAWATVSFSDDSTAARFGGDEFDTEFYRVRVGARVFDSIALEGHVGIADQKGSETGKYENAEYYGVYIVPTGVLFDFVEVAAPIGYSMMTIERGNVDKDIEGISFGLNLEIPLLTGSDWFPDVRIGGGGTVYQAERKSRVYGFHAGLRIDFGV